MGRTSWNRGAMGLEAGPGSSGRGNGPRERRRRVLVIVALVMVGATAGVVVRSSATRSTQPGPTAVDRQLAIVTGTSSEGGTRYLRVDDIEMLTGTEAGAAAAAHGDESPPPNDYYIVNDDPTVREVPVAADATVRVVVNADGTVNPTGYGVSLADWVASITGPSSEAYLANPYWLASKGGTVTSIEQLYLP